MNNLRLFNGLFLAPKDSSNELVDSSFPCNQVSNHQEVLDKAAEEHNLEDDCPFTVSELRVVTYSLLKKKAPGSDELPADICQEAITFNKELFLDLLKCLHMNPKT